jgi:hypothetical protein
MLSTLCINVNQTNCDKGDFLFPPILLMLVEKYVRKSISVSQNSAQSDDDDDDDDTCIFSSCDLIIRVFVEVE